MWHMPLRTRLRASRLNLTDSVHSQKYRDHRDVLPPSGDTRGGTTARSRPRYGEGPALPGDAGPVRDSRDRMADHAPHPAACSPDGRARSESLKFVAEGRYRRASLNMASPVHWRTHGRGKLARTREPAHLRRGVEACAEPGITDRSRNMHGLRPSACRIPESIDLEKVDG